MQTAEPHQGIDLTSQIHDCSSEVLNNEELSVMNGSGPSINSPRLFPPSSDSEKEISNHESNIASSSMPSNSSAIEIYTKESYEKALKESTIDLIADILSERIVKKLSKACLAGVDPTTFDSMSIGSILEMSSHTATSNMTTMSTKKAKTTSGGHWVDVEDCNATRDLVSSSNSTQIEVEKTNVKEHTSNIESSKGNSREISLEVCKIKRKETEPAITIPRNKEMRRDALVTTLTTTTGATKEETEPVIIPQHAETRKEVLVTTITALDTSLAFHSKQVGRGGVIKIRPDVTVKLPHWAHYSSPLSVDTLKQQNQSCSDLVNDRGVAIEVMRYCSSTTDYKVVFTFTLNSSTTLIGRGGVFSKVINDEHIEGELMPSLKHCALLVNNSGEMFLMDLKSTHGTFVSQKSEKDMYSSHEQVSSGNENANHLSFTKLFLNEIRPISIGDGFKLASKNDCGLLFKIVAKKVVKVSSIDEEKVELRNNKSKNYSERNKYRERHPDTSKRSRSRGRESKKDRDRHPDTSKRSRCHDRESKKDRDRHPDPSRRSRSRGRESKKDRDRHQDTSKRSRSHDRESKKDRDRHPDTSKRSRSRDRESKKDRDRHPDPSKRSRSRDRESKKDRDRHPDPSRRSRSRGRESKKDRDRHRDPSRRSRSHDRESKKDRDRHRDPSKRSRSHDRESKKEIREKGPVVSSN